MAASSVGRAPRITSCRAPAARAGRRACLSRQSMMLRATGARLALDTASTGARRTRRRGSAFDHGWARAPLARPLRESALWAERSAVCARRWTSPSQGANRLDAIQDHQSHIRVGQSCQPPGWTAGCWMRSGAWRDGKERWWRSRVGLISSTPGGGRSWRRWCSTPCRWRRLPGHAKTDAAPHRHCMASAARSVLAFTEGTRSRDGRDHGVGGAPDSGTGRPIVLVARGTVAWRCLLARVWPRHTRVAVRFGRPSSGARCTVLRDLTARVDGALRAPPRGRDYVVERAPRSGEA